MKGSQEALVKADEGEPWSFWMEAEASNPAQWYAQMQYSSVVVAGFEEGYMEEGELPQLVTYSC